jgi:hypothetical protein
MSIHKRFSVVTYTLKAMYSQRCSKLNENGRATSGNIEAVKTTVFSNIYVLELLDIILKYYIYNISRLLELVAWANSGLVIYFRNI